MVDTMSQSGSVNVGVKEITQVCIVVRDLNSTVEDFWDILGIGPWTIFQFGSPLVSVHKYYGKYTWSRIRVAQVQLGPLELQLVQPVEGQSIYQDWLDKHSEGFHHLKFISDDVQKTIDEMAKQGFYGIQSGRFGPNSQNQFCLYNVEPLHIIWEVGDKYETILQSITTYPANVEQRSPAKFKVRDINQVAIAVRDIEETVENYWRILGIGPWEIRDWEYPIVYDRTYKGKPAWAREKLAHAFIGNVDLELVQYIDGESTYKDWINEHGEGLHHLRFFVDDVDKAAETFNELGFSSLQSGRIGQPKNRPGYHYIYIDPTHVIWEPVLMPREGRAAALGQVTFYPANSKRSI